MMVKRYLDGAVNESSADREIRDCTLPVKIWRLAPGGTGSYAKQAGSPSGRRNLKSYCKSKYSIFRFV